MRILFYPHAYLRDRHLDTIRAWPPDEVINNNLLDRTGDQVSRAEALTPRRRVSWKALLPLPNVKRRPSGISRDVVVYVWGAVMTSGPFIVDLDNPFALVGYNFNAIKIWRPFLRYVLLSKRCIEVRCLSKACRESLRIVLGDDVAKKASVVYPIIAEGNVKPRVTDAARFLFIGTQFDIKGGKALLAAWKIASAKLPNATLTIITHLPPDYADDIKDIPNINLHPARYNREEILNVFMRNSDVLILPSYMESFGMVALEAIACGLALITTDVYALGEMVEDHISGRLLTPPISAWDGYLPSSTSSVASLKESARKLNTTAFEGNLAQAMISLGQSPEALQRARDASLALFRQRFQRSEN